MILLVRNRPCVKTRRTCWRSIGDENCCAMAMITAFLVILAMAFGGLAIRDFRMADIGFGFVIFERDRQPLVYWPIIAMEALLAAFFAILAYSAFTLPSGCNPDKECIIVIEAQAP